MLFWLLPRYLSYIGSSFTGEFDQTHTAQSLAGLGTGRQQMIPNSILWILLGISFLGMISPIFRLVDLKRSLRSILKHDGKIDLELPGQERTETYWELKAILDASKAKMQATEKKYISLQYQTARIGRGDHLTPEKRVILQEVKAALIELGQRIREGKESILESEQFLANYKATLPRPDAPARIRVNRNPSKQDIESILTYFSGESGANASALKSVPA
ncbi:hypothetical protein [Lewinella sp. JB7]|uniref:hypothetical protein n=1 Tax=Lewinella sp. JB7 TaxID=2962887 RepID=UPI0020C998F8|nr:hypothetical protein [Lewinella sp. JB7]MCP9237169.1 hypothetical protein [Lewinella sp. JB7]